jgi:pimeloyl-ACP methyl ester carboxylesterase
MRFVFAWGLGLAACFASARAADGPAVEDVAFTAKCDGTEQRYVLLLPAGFQPDRPHDVLIALHGHGSDRWQFVRDPRDECRAARDVAAKHQMIYVSPDYRARTSWMGLKAEADLVQIIAELRHKHRVARVFVCGGSMGGTSALTFAALHPELVAGAAAMNGTANLLEYNGFQDAISESFGGTKRALPEEYKKRSAEYWPERLTMPVAMTTGGRDTLVPPHSCQRLAQVLEQLGRDVRLLHREQGGHSTNLEDAQAAIEFVIQKAPPADVPRGEVE